MCHNFYHNTVYLLLKWDPCFLQATPQTAQPAMSEGEQTIPATESQLYENSLEKAAMPSQPVGKALLSPMISPRSPSNVSSKSSAPTEKKMSEEESVVCSKLLEVFDSVFAARRATISYITSDHFISST